MLRDRAQPAYVDVAVRRWQAFTGEAAILDGTGQSLAEVAEQRRFRSNETVIVTAPGAVLDAIGARR